MMGIRLKPSPRMRDLYWLYATLLVFALAGWTIPFSLLLPGIAVYVVAFVWIPALTCLAVFAYWLPRYYESLVYMVREDRVIAKGGVWWKWESSVPISKVNNVVWTQGVFERAFGLASLGFHTAAMGTPRPEIAFRHLEAEEAERVRREILEKIRGVPMEEEKGVRELLEEVVEELRAIRRLMERS